MRIPMTANPRRTRWLALLVCAATTLAVTAAAQLPARADHTDPGPAVRVNQYAYTVGGAKGATFVTSSSTGQTWELVNAANTVVASGTTRVHGHDQASGDNVHRIDFSNFTTLGTGYRLRVAGQQSHPFAIAEDPWGGLRDDALAFFYHQRSGIAIEAQYVGGEYDRPAGHVDVAPNQGDGDVGCWNNGCDYTLDVTGGWYDAGDQGKYVINGGISTWELQNAYERALHTPGADPSVYADGSLAIPEAGNGVPDVLDEARWHVEFMMNMQVPAGEPLAGMAHHKVHDENWTALPLLPHQDPEPRRLSPPSVTATLNLAAAAAQAARLWEDHDPAFAAEALAAARTAYDAAEANPNRLPDENDTTGGGSYYDGNATDEFYWAAAELFTTTGEQRYRDDLTASTWWYGRGFDAWGFNWHATAPLADLTLALVPNGLSQSQIQSLRSSVVTGADRYVAAARGQGYPVPYATPNHEYVWGSNSNILANTMVAAYAYDFTGDRAYLDTVSGAMEYLLGRNALGQSFVTGYGTKDSHNQHHRFWANQLDPSLPNPPPGTLAGGPNSSIQDEVAQEHLAGCRGPKCYMDDIGSWSTNEVTVNWNAPLAWVAAFLSDEADAGPEEPGDDGCRASMRITGEWDSGFQAEVTVANPGPTAITDWTVAWSWPANQQVNNLWNATWTQSGPNVTTTDLTWNARIEPDRAITFGLTATGPATTPTAFTCTT